MKPLLWMCTAALALPTISCARFLFGPPNHIAIRFQGAETPNATDRGESKPLEIRFFMLKDTAKFQKAAFKDLEGDLYKTTLGDEVVGDSCRLHLFPSPKKLFSFGRSPPVVKYVGMVAVFTRPDGSLSQDRAWVPRDELDYYTYEIKDNRLIVTRE